MKPIALTLSVAGLLALTAVGCGGSSSGDSAPRRRGLTIGFLMDTQHERWQRDRELFVERAQYRQANVIVEAAEGDKTKQAQLGEKMLAEGIKTLVLIPTHAEEAAAIVEKAKSTKVPVVSYDRLVRNADVDLFVSFDSVKVGELQANYLLSRAPKGNYLLIGGSPNDTNAQAVREGQMNVLGPAVKKGDIKIVGDGWAEGWRADQAARLTEEALTKTGNKLAAIVASNDQTAGGAIGVLEKHGLAGKVLVSGQDAELDAVRRIVAGTQAMTVYKPIRPLARGAASAAVQLAKKEKVEGTSTINNGLKEVQALLLTPISVHKDLIDQIIINDKFHTRQQVYGAK
jgi:D-xylose transport system substrate-binding protein